MNPPLWVHLLRAVVVFGFFLLSTVLLIWGERRLLARMQSRLGPNRVGPWGLMQTLVDGVKMFFKEDVTPRMVDRVVYGVAPLVGVVTGFASMAVVPLGAVPGMYPDDPTRGLVPLGGEMFPLHVADLDVGVLWFLAMGSIHVYSIFLAGWASNSPYPLLGGVRSSAQMISYEIAQGLAVGSVFVYAGSLRVSDIVATQAGPSGLLEGIPNWFALPLLPAFLIFVIGMVAEAGRPPMDLAEAEGELVAGFHTEYSGLRFGMFMLAEFLAVVTMSAMVVTLFLGGPSGPVFGPPEIAWVFPVLWFTLKTFGFVFFFVLLRGTLPRMRYDKLMDLGWRVLIPVGLVWVLATAGMVLANERLSATGRLAIAGVGVLVVGILYALAPLLTRSADDVVGEPAPVTPPTEEVRT